MYWPLKLLLFGMAAIAIPLLAAASWFFLYSRDLPDVTRLARFAPATKMLVSDSCLETTSVAIPYESVSENLRNALGAVEIKLSVQISRSMYCAPSKMLNRQLGEIRTAVQLERHFSRQELFTIYANRVYLGRGLTGVKSASQYFFHKNPSDLDVAEAALLAGLVKSPSFYSPVKHSDRAITRRNGVIDAMLRTSTSTITASEAEAAKSAPLGVAANDVVPRMQ